MAKARKKKATAPLFADPERWFHVVANGKVWGFASEGGFITKFPREHDFLKNKTLQEARPWFIENKASVTEIKTTYVEENL